MKKSRKICLKDVTLREGLDVPNLSWTTKQKLVVAERIIEAGFDEVEIVAPSATEQTLSLARVIRRKAPGSVLSGIVYATRDDLEEIVDKILNTLDRIDILVPAIETRKPFSLKDKILLIESLRDLVRRNKQIGIGFPNIFQTKNSTSLKLIKTGSMIGAGRITLYDTNGSINPLSLVWFLKNANRNTRTPVFIHCHNDLGMATANSVVAAYYGIRGLDVSINGIGDRAGNACAEEVVTSLLLAGFEVPVDIRKLIRTGKDFHKITKLRKWPLSPIIGEYAFQHVAAGHLESIPSFEAINPYYLGLRRSVVR